MSAPLNPIEAAFAAPPSWMLAIRNFDAIEVHIGMAKPGLCYVFFFRVFSWRAQASSNLSCIWGASAFAMS